MTEKSQFSSGTRKSELKAWPKMIKTKMNMIQHAKKIQNQVIQITQTISKGMETLIRSNVLNVRSKIWQRSL